MGQGKATKLASIGVIISLVLIGSLLFSAGAASPNPDVVRFDLAQDPFIAYFTINCSVSETSLELKPGQSKTISFNTSAATSEIGINILGQRLAGAFNTPIGTLSVPILSAGVVSGNIDLKGKLEGSISVSGPGTMDQQNLTWAGWGERSLTITVSDSAQAGDTILITMQPYYTVDVGASTTLLFFFNVPIADITALRMAGSPSLTVSITVINPQSFPTEIIIGGVALVAVAAVAVYLMRRNRSV